MKPLHISLNTAHSGCKPSSSVSFFTHSLQVSCPCPHTSPLPPPHFYRPTPNHLHSYVPHAQTIPTKPNSNHDILIEKLSRYGIRGIANDWFHNYLNFSRNLASFKKTLCISGLNVMVCKIHLKFNGILQFNFCGFLSVTFSHYNS